MENTLPAPLAVTRAQTTSGANDRAAMVRPGSHPRKAGVRRYG